MPNSITGVGASLVRVSGDRQDTERQVADIARWEREHGVSVEHKFSDKESRLLSERRPDFQRLLALVDSRQVDWVVIQTTDRLGFKHSYELFEFISRFLRSGVRLYTAVDDRCLTSTDDFTVIMNAISGQTSQKELQEKALRSQTKRILKGRAGQFMGGMPPYGFDVICKDAQGNIKWRFVQTGRRRGEWIRGEAREEVNRLPPHNRDEGETLWLAPSIVTERVEVVRRIFDWCCHEAISTLGIARRLDSEGISPVLGERWSHSKVWALLQNPVVIGRPSSNKVTSAKVYKVLNEKLVGRDPLEPYQRHAREHWILPETPIFPPLIPEEQFWACSSKVHDNSKRAPRNENLILSGLLVCGTCGRALAGQYKAKYSAGKRVPGFYSYYRCQSYMNSKDANPFGCRNHGTLQDRILPYVHEFLASRGQAISDLVGSHRDKQTLLALIAEKRSTDQEVGTVLDRMLFFTNDALSRIGEAAPDYADPTDHASEILDLYDRVFTDLRADIEQELAVLEAKHTEMSLAYLSLPPMAQEKALAAITLTEHLIGDCQARLAPLGDRWGDLLGHLADLRERLATAQIALEKGTLRQQSQALRSAIDRIEVHYVPKGKAHSTLERIRIVPLVGSPQEYAVSGEGTTVASATPGNGNTLVILLTKDYQPLATPS